MECPHCPADIGERLASIETTLKSIDKAVNGNGQPGLLQRVSALEMRWHWVLGVAAAIGALGGLLVPAIRAALR